MDIKEIGLIGFKWPIVRSSGGLLQIMFIKSGKFVDQLIGYQFPKKGKILCSQTFSTNTSCSEAAHILKTFFLEIKFNIILQTLNIGNTVKTRIKCSGISIQCQSSYLASINLSCVCLSSCRHLWQANSVEELSEWCAKLTGVVCALKRWNITAQHV